MRSIQKRHSWPPPRVTKSSSASSSIDQDPFAYFVSPNLDDESALQAHLTAGITNRRRSRSLPSFHPKPKHSLPATGRAKRRVARLKTWIDRMQMVYFHQSSSEQVIPTPPPVPPEALEELTLMERGRNTESSATSRIRASTRTPPRKPRAWRQPSDNIWPVFEETEDIGLGIRDEAMDHWV